MSTSPFSECLESGSLLIYASRGRGRAARIRGAILALKRRDDLSNRKASRAGYIAGRRSEDLPGTDLEDLFHPRLHLTPVPGTLELARSRKEVTEVEERVQIHRGRIVWSGEEHSRRDDD